MPIVQAVNVRLSTGEKYKLQALLCEITHDQKVAIVHWLDLPVDFYTTIGKRVHRHLWLTFADLLDDECGPYGFPWDSEILPRKVRLRVIQEYKLDWGFDGSSDYFLRVLYHGTSLEAAAAIVRSRLRAGPTPAMLGIGVYFGSFWKACRYAMFENTRDWAERKDRLHGSVLRCVIRMKKSDYLRLPKDSWSCPCYKCTNRIRTATDAQVEHRKRVAQLCDHESAWHASYKIVEVTDTLSTMTHGESCVRDDAIRDSVVVLDWGNLDLRTRSEPYDPSCKDHRLKIDDT